MTYSFTLFDSNILNNLIRIIKTLTCDTAGTGKSKLKLFFSYFLFFLFCFSDRLNAQVNSKYYEGNQNIIITNSPCYLSPYFCLNLKKNPKLICGSIFGFGRWIDSFLLNGIRDLTSHLNLFFQQ